MRSFKRVVSFVISIAIVIGMIPLSVFSVFAEDSNNESNINYDNIPHNNVIVSPTEHYMTGNGNVSASKVKLTDYYNSEGLLVNETVVDVFGNVLYCYSNVEESEEHYYYFKYIPDGSIIYAEQNYIKVEEYLSDSSDAKKKKVSQLIRLGSNHLYDVLNVITGDFFDYDFDDNEPYDAHEIYDLQFHGDTVLVAKDGKIGIMGSDGKLLTELIFDDAYYTEDGKYIYVESFDGAISLYGIYDNSGNMFFECEYESIEWYHDAKVFKTTKYDNDGTCYSAIYNDKKQVLFTAQSKIRNIKEINESLFFNAEDKEYIIYSNGKTIDLTTKYGGVTSYLYYGASKEDPIKFEVYDLDYNFTFAGYIDCFGNMLFDYTEKYQAAANDYVVDFYVCNFNDGYAKIVDNDKSYYINTNGERVSEISYSMDLSSQYSYSVEKSGTVLYIDNSYGNRRPACLCDYNDEVLYELTVETRYSDNIEGAARTSDRMINYHSRKMYVLEAYVGNDEITGYSYGVFFTETKEFTGFIYTGVGGLLKNNEDYQVISCVKPDGTCDVYNSDGKLLFNQKKDDFFRFDSGNILVVDRISDEGNYSGIPLSKLYKIIDVDGNVIFEDSNYRFIERFENDTFIFASTIDIQKNGAKCVGAMDSEGKIVVSPKYNYDSTSDYFSYLNNDYYFAFTGTYNNGDFYLLNSKNEAILHFDCFTNNTVKESGTFFCRSYEAKEIYLYWLNDSFEFKNDLTIYSENDKYTLAIGEELTIYVKTDAESLMQYDGVYSVTSSNTDVVKIESQETGIVSAVLTGTTVGATEITISFDDGREVYAAFNVELSNNNVLQYFPELVMDNEMSQIFENAIDCCYQINNSYSGWDDAVASYFTCLKSGGAKVITQTVLSKFGLAPSQKDECVDEAVIALMNEICNVDTTFSETVDTYSKKWSTAKSHYKATNESLKEFAKYASKISNYSETDIVTATSEIIDAYGEGVSVMGEFVDIYDIVTVVLCTESIQIDVVNQLLNIIDPETDLYDGLLRLKIDLSTGFVQRVSSQYINDKVIDDIASSLIEDGIVGMDSFSKVYTTLAKICINLIVDKYKDAGGVMASDICLAIYTTTFASQIECELNAELLNYRLGRVENYNKFQWLYNCYTASLCVALENCAAICKPAYSFLKDDANKYLKVIKYNCTFDNFIDISRKAALNNYPVEYQYGLDENGDWILIKKYQQISRYALRTAQTTRNSGEIIYIPSIIDGNKITSIADGAFRDNLSIKGVIIEDGIKRIGKEAFKGCSNLEFIMLGDVLEIGEDAFSECTSLELVSLSPNIQIIKSGTFKDCRTLASITLPESVQSIEDNAFIGCYSLNAITFMNDEIILLDFDVGSQLTDIYGRKGSSSEKFATEKGILFHEIFKEVINLEIVSLPNSSVFNCDEELDLEGLKLLATFVDGSEITIDSGYDVLYTNEPGNQSITICFRNAKTSFEAQLVEKPLDEIDLNKNSLELFVGENFKLEFTNSIPLYIQDKVVWHSSDESVASINDGMVRAISNGEVDIVASLNNDIFATCSVIVNNEKSLELDENNKHCSATFVAPIGGYYRFSANGTTIFAYHESGNAIESGDNQIITHLEKGMMIFLTFEKSYYNLSNYTLKVEYIDAIPSSIEVSRKPYKKYCYSGINEYDFSGLEVTFSYTDGSTYVWRYDNQTAILDLYPSILQTGNRVHVFWQELHCSVDLEYREYTALEIGESQNTSIKRNYSSVFSFIPDNSEGYGLYVEHNDNFEQSNITVRLYENNDGILTEVMESIGHIRYDYIVGKEYAFCISSDCIDFQEIKVEISELTNAESISIVSNDGFDGFVNDTLQLSVEFLPITARIESLEWSSDDNSVATVDDNGMVTLLEVGTATITATTENGLTDSVVVTVMTIPEVALDEVNTVEITEYNQSKRYKFTPSETGSYSFEIESEDTIYFEIRNEYGNYITGSNNTFNYQLTAGETYYISTHYTGGNTGSYTFKISEAVTISKIEITALPDHMDYYVGFEDFSYYGLKVRATFEDGSTVDWSYDSWESLAGYDVEINNDYFDNTYLETIVSCGGKTATFKFNIKENPVDHLELVSGTSRNYIENYNGYINSDGNFIYWTNHPDDAVIKIVYTDGAFVTAEVGEYVDNHYISWNDDQSKTPWIVGTDNSSTITYLGHTVNLPITVEKNKVASIEVVSGKVTCIENTYGYETGDGYYYYYDVPSDVTVKINYTDGTSKTVGIKDDVDGYGFSWDDEQHETPWVLGDDNYLTLSYLGITTQLPVSVIANPVDHIEINSAPTREYVYGDMEYGYSYSDGDYEFYPTDMTGLSFTVYYTDGTSKTFTYEDIDENDYINGYGYNLYYDEYNPVIGNFPVTFEYMGKSADYTVLLKESTVTSIAVTKKPTKTEYTNDYSPDFIGMKLTITYTDGTTKVVTLTEDNLVYEYTPWWGELCYKVEVDGHTLTIEPYYGEDMYYVAYYLGSRYEIKDITFTESKEIKSVELDNVSWNGDGMTVKITYADETTETLTLDIADFYDFEDSSGAGYGKTDNGLLYYYIETYTDESGNVEEYIVSILGKDITVEAETVVIADINGDGDVNNKDVTMLRRYLIGGWDVTIDTVAADVNKDGSINNKDVTLLRRYLIGGWNVTLG